jgi:CheY-like chemotaxis protein
MGAPPLHDSPPAAVNKPVRLTNGRVLVVDDERMILRIVSRILSPAHEVVVTTSAREALALLKSGERFDVILSDLMLPDMTGMDLYGELAATAPEVAASVIFLTGGALTLQTREFLDTVPNRYLEKPFDPKELEMLVRERIG